MKNAIISVIHTLSGLSIAQIEQGIELIKKDPVFNDEQKESFITLCRWAIEEKRGGYSG